MIRLLAFALVLTAISAPSLADPVLRWAPDGPVVPQGGEITLSVMLDDTLTIRTIELYVAYDPELVTSISGGPGSLFNGFNLFPGFAEVDPAHPGL